MKKFLVLAAAALIAGCSQTKEVVDIYQGPPGTPGLDGTSCSTYQTEGGALIECTDGTVAYILNGLNGSNGQDGNDGQDGEDGQDGTNGTNGGGVTITVLSASSCTLVAGSSPSHYVKNGDLYDSAGCHSSDKIALQVGESVWVASAMLVARDSSGLRSIKFN